MISMRSIFIFSISIFLIAISGNADAQSGQYTGAGRWGVSDRDIATAEISTLLKKSGIQGSDLSALKSAAENGDAVAAFLLAKAISGGWRGFTALSWESHTQWLERAAKAGLPRAMTEYYREEMRDADLDSALRKMADKGELEALFYLSIRQRDQVGIKRAADLGFVPAFCAAASDQHDTIAVSIAKMSRAAETGSINCAFELGNAYDRGYLHSMRDMSVNHQKALYFYNLGAQFGDTGNYIKLGDGYQYYQDAQAFDLSLQWYKACLDVSSPGGFDARKCYRGLGDLYAYGRGVPRDYTAAIEQYRLSEDEGYYMMGVLTEHGWGMPADRAAAIGWYQKAWSYQIDPDRTKAALKRLGAFPPQ